MKHSKKKQKAKIIQFEPASGHDSPDIHRQLDRFYLESLEEIDRLLSNRKKSPEQYPPQASGSKR